MDVDQSTEGTNANAGGQQYVPPEASQDASGYTTGQQQYSQQTGQQDQQQTWQPYQESSQQTWQPYQETSQQGQQNYQQQGYDQQGYQQNQQQTYQQGYDQQNQQGYQQGQQQTPFSDSNYQAPYAPYQQQNGQPVATSQKSHIAAGVLAIFLGTLGIHKFYLGYNKEGVIMLLVAVLGGAITFGVATYVIEIIGIVEGIIYLAKDQQEFDSLYVYGRHPWF